MAVTDVADESPPRWSRHDDHPPPRHDQSGSTPSDLVASLQRELDAALALDWDTVDGDIVADVAVATLNLAAKLDALRAKVATALDRSGIWAEQGHGSAAGVRVGPEATEVVGHALCVTDLHGAEAATVVDESGAATLRTSAGGC